jgi:hypothetical protein
VTVAITPTASSLPLPLYQRATGEILFHSIFGRQCCGPDHLYPELAFHIGRLQILLLTKCVPTFLKLEIFFAQLCPETNVYLFMCF